MVSGFWILLSDGFRIWIRFFSDSDFLVFQVRIQESNSFGCSGLDFVFSRSGFRGLIRLVSQDLVFGFRL
jgi:hypothetical protein